MKKRIFRSEQYLRKRKKHFPKVYAFSVSQSLTVTQSNSVDYAFYAESISQSLTINQSLHQQNIYVTSTLTLSQTPSHNSNAGYSLSNTLVNLRQAADEFRSIPITSILTVTQLVDEQQTISPVPDPVISLVQTVSLSYTHSQNASNRLIFFQTASWQSVKPKSFTNTLTLTQSVSVSKTISQSVTSQLFLNEQIVEKSLTALINSLTITQTITNVTYKIRTLTNNLTIQQSLTKTRDANYSLTNTLVFLPYHYVSTTLVSNVIVTKSNANCCNDINKTKTIIHGSTFDIVLPNPEYGDTETPLTSVKLQRTINGAMYTYIRKNIARKLKYKFIIDRKKAYELRQFVYDNDCKTVTIYNFKGEQWLVNIITNPIEFTATKSGGPPCGELFETEIEFQGIKLN